MTYYKSKTFIAIPALTLKSFESNMWQHVIYVKLKCIPTHRPNQRMAVSTQMQFETQCDPRC